MKRSCTIRINILSLLITALFCVSNAIETTLVIDDYSSQTGTIYTVPNTVENTCLYEMCSLGVTEYIDQTSSSIYGNLRLTKYFAYVNDEKSPTVPSSVSGDVKVSGGKLTATGTLTNAATTNEHHSFYYSLTYLAYSYCQAPGTYPTQPDYYPPDCEKYPQTAHDLTVGGGDSIAFKFTHNTPEGGELPYIGVDMQDTLQTVGGYFFYAFDSRYYDQSTDEYIVPLEFNEDDVDGDVTKVQWISIGAGNEGFLSAGSTVSYEYSFSNFRIVSKNAVPQTTDESTAFSSTSFSSGSSSSQSSRSSGSSNGSSFSSNGSSQSSDASVLSPLSLFFSLPFVLFFSFFLLRF